MPSQLQRCQPCACGKGAVQVAQVALQHSLAQVVMVMPQRLGRAPVLRGLGQELLEHFLLVIEAVMDPVRYQMCQ